MINWYQAWIALCREVAILGWLSIGYLTFGIQALGDNSSYRVWCGLNPNPNVNTSYLSAAEKFLKYNSRIIWRKKTYQNNNFRISTWISLKWWENSIN